MSKINKIKVNGTPYEVEDKEAVKTVTLTQEEYDALQTKDPSIFYVISDGQGGGGGMTSGEVQTMIDSSISGKADSSGVTQEISAATSGKVDTTTFNTYSGAVDTALSGKQETLVSGTNIKTINGNSVLGSGNITISGGGSGSSAVEVTQAEYDALVSGGTLDPSVLYIITDAVGGDLSNYMTSAQTMNAISAATSTKQDILSAGTGIDITDNTISVTGGGITSGEVQTMIDDSISGKVDTSAITSSVTSASTDSEVPTAKAVHGVATTDEYPIEGVLSAKHFWDDENMGAYTEIGSLNNIKVPNSSLLSNPYISYVFAENEEFMGDTCALVATVTSGSIASVELLNGSSVSSVTATYDNDYMYFTTSASSFSADGLYIVAVMGNDFKPSNVMELRMQITESAVDCGVISVVGNIPSEPTKDSIKRIYDDLSSFDDVNPIADTITLDNGNNNSGRDNTLIGYGVLNYNTYNPLTNTITSGNTADVFKYNVIDFKGDNNVLRFNKTIIDKSTYSSITPQFAISSFTDGDTSSYNYELFHHTICMIVETNPNASGGGGMGDEINISISGPNNIEGEISFQLRNSTLEANVTYNNKTVNKVLYSFAYGQSFLIDLREYWDDTYGTHTFTVDNWRGSDMLTSISFYNVNDRNQLHLEDAVEMLMDKETITLDELDDKLIDYASIESVNIYEYGNPSAVTVSTSSLDGTFYGFSVSGIPSGNTVQWYISDGQVSRYYGMTNGVIENFNDSTFDHCLNKELTNYENGVVNVFLNTSDAYISRIYMSSQSYQGTVYQSITVTPIKDALSGSVSSAVTSGDTNAVSSDAVYTAMGGLKLQQITQADYDALISGGTVDASTLYIITNVVN